MNFTLKRSQHLESGIFGYLTDSSGKAIFHTLEHAFLMADSSFYPIVPDGSYTCIRRHSPRFGFDVFMLKDVPGHDLVEVHPGNYNKDSDGCILLGMSVANQPDGSFMLSQSREAFQEFMSLQTGVDSFTLSVLS